MSDDDIIAFITQFTEEHKYAPSFREIGAKFNITSTSAVSYRIQKLENAGRLRRTIGVFRSIVVIKEDA